ncbi:uncharacterized protein LAESUDRAFT_798984 [Laetiporus sulphureus 93-53]|uniref:Uncharacterized protein n=1 Tax=Laetiporus sulphureus 93-53 TaxID=1314785 RepID=A0A165BFJ3_9APHY|nr:uncharacterized protein LAESUDRAFT_798984 [Laetiporus sulphureus 93-53]KZT00947.1 hypothetical protein LAESUDRAFT_798984 [Laetiporus sulphureus 93-53]
MVHDGYQLQEQSTENDHVPFTSSTHAHLLREHQPWKGHRTTGMSMSMHLRSNIEVVRSLRAGIGASPKFFGKRQPYIVDTVQDMCDSGKRTLMSVEANPSTVKLFIVELLRWRVTAPERTVSLATCLAGYLGCYVRLEDRLDIDRQFAPDQVLDVVAADINLRTSPTQVVGALLFYAVQAQGPVPIMRNVPSGPSHGSGRAHVGCGREVWFIDHVGGSARREMFSIESGPEDWKQKRREIDLTNMSDTMDRNIPTQSTSVEGRLQFIVPISPMFTDIPALPSTRSMEYATAAPGPSLARGNAFCIGTNNRSMERLTTPHRQLYLSGNNDDTIEITSAST